MGQINSGIGTKSCSYDFGQNGALGSGVYAFSGISMKPGEAILDIRITKELNMTSSGGGGTTFSLGWGPNPSPASTYFVTMFQDTLTNINGYAFNLWQSPTINQAFKLGFNWRLPATLSTSLNLWFTSSAAMTAGKVNFLVTFGLTKF